MTNNNIKKLINVLLNLEIKNSINKLISIIKFLINKILL